MIIGDLFRGFWNTATKLAGFLHPYNSTVRTPELEVRGEFLEDISADDSDLGPAFHTRSGHPTPIPTPVPSRRSYTSPQQPTTSQAIVSHVLAPISRVKPAAVFPSSLARKPIGSVPAAKRPATDLTPSGSPPKKVAASDVTPEGASKRPVGRPANGSKSATTSNVATVAPASSSKREALPTPRATRSQSRGRTARSAVKEPTGKTSPALAKSEKKTLGRPKSAAETHRSSSKSKKSTSQGKKRKAAFEGTRRPTRAHHEGTDLITPTDIDGKLKRSKKTALSGTQKTKSAKI